MKALLAITILFCTRKSDENSKKKFKVITLFKLQLKAWNQNLMGILFAMRGIIFYMIRGLSQMNVKTMIYGLLKVATVIILSPNKNDFTKILAADPYINNKRKYSRTMYTP